MTELRRQNVSTRDTIRQTSDQLFQIRGDLGNRLQAIEDNLDRLTELMGQNQRATSAIRDQLEAGGRRTVTGGGDFGTPMTGGNAPGGGSPADAVASYNAAVEAYNRGSFTAARFGFEDFIQNFPADDLVPDAYYFLGEALVQLEQPDAAIEAYQQVLQRFPASPRVPSAQLGIGLTYMEQGDTTEARLMLNRLVATYPEHEAAVRAREALAQMGGGVRP
jgi:tol-pal system protein YbgF